MSKFKLTATDIIVGGVSIQAKTATADLQLTSDVIDVTCFGSTEYREKITGFKTNRFTCDGYWSIGSGDVDPTLWNNWASATAKVLTVCPQGNTTGKKSFSMKTIQTEYEFGGVVGEAAKFNIAAEGTSGMFRGTVIMTGTTATTVGTVATPGPIHTLGATTAGTHVHAVFQLTDIGNADTVAITLLSDDSTAFSSATTRGTFSASSANEAQWLTPIAGAITDTYWRAVATVSGSSDILSATAFTVSVGML